jgi:hypothetical protein
MPWKVWTVNDGVAEPLESFTDHNSRQATSGQACNLLNDERQKPHLKVVRIDGPERKMMMDRDA